jgi:outer membrane protein assembly factor BamE
VRFILGTPLIVDPFHHNRWDYVYRLEKEGKVVDNRRITVIFEDERLKLLQGDVLPKPDVLPTSAQPEGGKK